MLRIADLCDYPQHAPQISRWMWEEWDKHRGWTFEQSLRLTATALPRS